MRFTVKVEWQQEDGTVVTAELGKLNAGGLRSATDLGLKLFDTKPILTRLQNIVTVTQVRSSCESVRNCPSCRVPRRIKDYRERKLHSVCGTVILRTPRFERCRACDRRGTYSPLTGVAWWKTPWRFCKKQQMSWTRAGARKACSTSKLLHSMANYTNTPDTLSPGPLPRSPHLFYGPHLAGYELQPIASFPEQ
jgi:hypothetical protein